MLSALSAAEQEQLAALLRKLLVEFEGSQRALGLGLTLAPAHVTMALRSSVGLPPVPGLLVRAVDEDGPAAAAGLRTGDVLTNSGGGIAPNSGWNQRPRVSKPTTRMSRARTRGWK